MPANDFRERIDDWLDEQDHQNRLKFKTYASNLMIKFIEKLEALPDENGIPPLAAAAQTDILSHPAQNPQLSQSQYILDNVSPQTFTQSTGLPPTYLQTLATFPDIIEARNKACHDTELEFARLLLTRQFRDPVMAKEWNCEHWSKMLLWVTGYATLEDMKRVSRGIWLPPVLGK